MASCRFGVVRKGGGSGAVTVFWPGGGSRTIFYENGAPAAFDQVGDTEKKPLIVERNADLVKVGIGDERFEIPDAVINGG